MFHFFVDYVLGKLQIRVIDFGSSEREDRAAKPAGIRMVNAEERAAILRSFVPGTVVPTIGTVTITRRDGTGTWQGNCFVHESAVALFFAEVGMAQAYTATA